MAQISWTEPALTDLNTIADYIALDDFNAARKLVQQVFSSVERLESFPEIGRVPPELKGSSYRELIVGPCRLFYRIKKNTVYIVYIMRGEQQLRHYLIKERARKKT